jgi:hypothetical protein
VRALIAKRDSGYRRWPGRVPGKTKEQEQEQKQGQDQDQDQTHGGTSPHQ